MVLISEWLPNPIGADAQGEWLELWNNSATTVDMSGWKITADGKKLFTLYGKIDPAVRVVVPRSQSKLTLRNADGGLALYDPAGRLVDQLSFHGTAPEGESVNRGDVGGETFFGKPTPGLENEVAENILIGQASHPFGVPVGAAEPAMLHLAGLILGTAVALAAAVVFILKADENLSHAFFGRN